MTCAEWEIRIASEEDGAQTHIADCESCRRFAAELELNQSALRDDSDIDFAPARRPHRAPWWIYAAAAGFVLALLAYSTLASRNQPVEPIAFHLPAPHAPEVRISARTAVVARKAPPQRAAVIKIITDDPDVVILLVNSTGGL
jgi:hypothetical protein